MACWKTYHWPTHPESIPIDWETEVEPDWAYNLEAAAVGFNAVDADLMYGELRADWNGHPAGSYVFALTTREGSPFAVRSPGALELQIEYWDVERVASGMRRVEVDYDVIPPEFDFDAAVRSAGFAESQAGDVQYGELGEGRFAYYIGTPVLVLFGEPGGEDIYAVARLRSG